MSKILDDQICPVCKTYFKTCPHNLNEALKEFLKPKDSKIDIVQKAIDRLNIDWWKYWKENYQPFEERIKFIEAWALESYKQRRVLPFKKDKPIKEERRCLIGQEIKPGEKCYHHTKRIGGEPVFLCNSNCKNWIYKLPNEIEKPKDSDKGLWCKYKKGYCESAMEFKDTILEKEEIIGDLNSKLDTYRKYPKYSEIERLKNLIKRFMEASGKPARAWMIAKPFLLKELLEVVKSTQPKDSEPKIYDPHPISEIKKALDSCNLSQEDTNAIGVTGYIPLEIFLQQIRKITKRKDMYYKKWDKLWGEHEELKKDLGKCLNEKSKLRHELLDEAKKYEKEIEELKKSHKINVDFQNKAIKQLHEEIEKKS